MGGSGPSLSCELLCGSLHVLSECVGRQASEEEAITECHMSVCSGERQVPLSKVALQRCATAKSPRPSTRGARGLLRQRGEKPAAAGAPGAQERTWPSCGDDSVGCREAETHRSGTHGSGASPVGRTAPLPEQSGDGILQ